MESFFYRYIFYVFCIWLYQIPGTRERQGISLLCFIGIIQCLLTVAQAEYPPLELPWFENLRGIELFN